MQVKSMGITLAITAVAALAPAGAAQAGLLSKAKATGSVFTGERMVPPSSSSSAVDVGNGLVTVSSAQSSYESSSWSAASVAGTSLYGKETKANGSEQHTGLLAAIGPTIDQINGGENPCREVSDAEVCAGILAAGSFNHNDGPGHTTGAAGGVIAGAQITTADGKTVSVVLLPASAFHSSYCADSGAAVAAVVVDETVHEIDPSSAQAGCYYP